VIREEISEAHLDEHIFLSGLILRIVTLFIEVGLFMIPMILIINSLYSKNSKEFRITLAFLVIMNPLLMQQTILNGGVVNIIFVGSLFISLFTLMENYLEIAGGFFALALNTN
jgi:hypothetical protein